MTRRGEHVQHDAACAAPDGQYICHGECMAWAAEEGPPDEPILGVPPGPVLPYWGPTTEDRHMAFYHRVHEKAGDGWDVICTEHGRIAGGPGPLSLDKLQALLLSKEHELSCELIAAARLADPDHTCTPLGADWGMLWRCSCGQLWQLSPSQGRWITVDQQTEEMLAHLFGDGLP